MREFGFFGKATLVLVGLSIFSTFWVNIQISSLFRETPVVESPDQTTLSIYEYQKKKEKIDFIKKIKKRWKISLTGTVFYLFGFLIFSFKYPPGLWLILIGIPFKIWAGFLEELFFIIYHCVVFLTAAITSLKWKNYSDPES